jgi:hypothetical protein
MHYKCLFHVCIRIRNSSVGMRPGIHSQQGQMIFLFSTASRPVLGPTQSPIQLVPGVSTTYLHLVLRSRMVELYLHSPISLHDVRLIKHRDNFHLTVIYIYCPHTVYALPLYYY